MAADLVVLGDVKAEAGGDCKRRLVVAADRRPEILDDEVLMEGWAASFAACWRRRRQPLSGWLSFTDMRTPLTPGERVRRGRLQGGASGDDVRNMSRVFWPEKFTYGGPAAYDSSCPARRAPRPAAGSDTKIAADLARQALAPPKLKP